MPTIILPSQSEQRESLLNEGEGQVSKKKSVVSLWRGKHMFLWLKNDHAGGGYQRYLHLIQSCWDTRTICLLLTDWNMAHIWYTAQRERKCTQEKKGNNVVSVTYFCVHKPVETASTKALFSFFFSSYYPITPFQYTSSKWIRWLLEEIYINIIRRHRMITQ